MKPICEINSYGDKTWRLNGRLHREDGPAIERFNGDKYWYLNGKRHREAEPAAEYTDGTKLWFLDDEAHRDDGPAFEWSNGFKEWHYHGNRIHCKNNQEFLRIVKLMAFI